MKRYLILFIFFHSSLIYASKSIPKVVLDSKEHKITWGISSIGEQVMRNRSPDYGYSDNDILQFIKAVIKENKVIITPEMVIIRESPSDLYPCKYPYNYTQMPSVDYWVSAKRSESSNRILSKYGVNTNNLVGVIEAKEDSSGCRRDQEKFLLIGDKIIFSYEGRWVFFSIIKNEPDPVAKKNKFCTSPEQTPEEIFEGEGRRIDCFYNGFSLLKAYEQYRLDHDTDYLEKSIELNKNHKKEYPENGVSVDYKWIYPKKLVIDQQFQGGNTDIIVEKESSGIKITSFGHPD